MGKLQGKVAVITGGTQGIGLATAKLFASEGAHVFITGRRQKELEEAVASIGSNVTGVQGDVANLGDLNRLYESVKPKGRIDILFANVGLGGFVPLGSITEEYYDKTFDTNVKGLLFTVQKALPFLNDGASIILTGSAAAAKGTPSFDVYAASKAAIRSFVRSPPARASHSYRRDSEAVGEATSDDRIHDLAPRTRRSYSKPEDVVPHR